MLDHAKEASEKAAGRTRSDLDRDRDFGLVMTRLLEIVGEAAARVTEETRQRIPSIPWPSIVGLRNRLIHGYDSVDFDVLWATVRDDLPFLIAALSRELQDGEP